MASIDIKDAYYLISIDKSSRKFLRFQYSGVYYEFNCLPFGLNVAPFVFTKILKPVATYLRRQGFRSVFYLDDILLIGKSYEECAENFRATAAILEELGFIINHKKCRRIPAKRCQYLELIFDSAKMTIELPEDKIQRSLDTLKKFRKMKKCSIREFASCIGTLGSRCPALKYGMIHMRRFEKVRL